MDEEDWIFRFIDRSRGRLSDLAPVETSISERLTALLGRLRKKEGHRISSGSPQTQGSEQENGQSLD